MDHEGPVYEDLVRKDQPPVLRSPMARMKRIRPNTLLMVLLATTGACVSWQHARIEPEVLLQPGHEEYRDQVMFTLRDGSKVVLSQPELVNDTVHGTVGTRRARNQQPRAVPMDSIRFIEVQRAAGGSWGFIIALVVAGAVIVAIVQASVGG